MSTELKPCPFCGEAKDIEIDNSDTNASTWVVCHGCGARGGYMMSAEMAAKYWNMRLPAQESTE